MKKFLLLASAAVLGTSAMMAEEIDITPKAYHFNTATQLPLSTWTFHGANIAAPCFATADAGNLYNDGLLVVGGGQYNNEAQPYFANATAGMQLVDLGGEVGQVFAWVHEGGAEKVKAALKAATGYDYAIDKEITGAINWGNMNFFTDPKNTPTRDKGMIRVRITYNVFAPAYSANNIINKVYSVTDQGGVRPAQQDAEANTPFQLGDCFVEDPMTEEMAWDATKWCVYEWDTDCAEPAGETVYDPLRLKFEFAAQPGCALFIKDIELMLIEGQEAPRQGNGERLRSFVTLNPGEPNAAGIESAVVDNDAFTVSVNGSTVTFSAPAEVFTMTGAKVAAGTELDLAAGLYVARVGAKAVKFIVK
ncbi:MAG: hypothetical protein NC418_09590 [Muribaculaceae bacterium]|nr:hypothetical protein [Muribaculaceae bacterium]